MGRVTILYTWVLKLGCLLSSGIGSWAKRGTKLWHWPEAEDELVPSVLGRYGCATPSYDDSVVLIVSRPGGLTRNLHEWTRPGHLLCDRVVLNSVLMRFC